MCHKEKPPLSSFGDPEDADGELTVPFTTQTNFLLNGINFSTPISSHYISTPNTINWLSFPALPSLVAPNTPTGNYRAPPYVTRMPRVPRQTFRSPRGVDSNVEQINFQDETNDASSRVESMFLPELLKVQHQGHHANDLLQYTLPLYIMIIVV